MMRLACKHAIHWVHEDLLHLHAREFIFFCLSRLEALSRNLPKWDLQCMPRRTHCHQSWFL